MIADLGGRVPVFGPRCKIGLVVPANNSVIEPEFWSVLPAGVASYATRIMARGNLTPDSIRLMEAQVERAVDELAATGVDVIAYADMVTTFIMEAGWNEAKVAQIADRTGIRCVSAWTSLRDALKALGVRRLALGTPYPAAIHAMALPFLEAQGFTIVGSATLDILAMHDVPKIDGPMLEAFVRALPRSGAEAVVLLATDLPTFGSIARLEQACGCPVLSSNQVILWASLRAAGVAERVPDLGKLMEQ
jgi:maleate cis-trans isomerase